MKQPHPLKTDHLAIVIPLDSKKNINDIMSLRKQVKPPFPALPDVNHMRGMQYVLCI